MTRTGFLLVLLFCLVVSSCAAGDVTIRAEQRDFFFSTGTDAGIPLTLNNSYGHDIKGMLRFTTTAELPGGNDTRTLQEKAFTLFAGQRSYLLPAGRSDRPASFRCDIAFVYNDLGGRKATLNGIGVHFVENASAIRAVTDPQESTDLPDVQADPKGAPSGSGSPPASDPFGNQQNSQIGQDMEGLREQLQEEDAVSRKVSEEFLSVLLREPTVAGVNRSLVSDGFRLTDPMVSPVTNLSGNFSFSYDRNGRSATLQGALDQGVLLFADAYSAGILPVPDILSGNATFRSWESELGQDGYLRSGSRIHFRPGAVIVNLTYENAENRMLQLDAAIINGTITELGRRAVAEPVPFLMPVLSGALIIVLSGGILFFGRRIRTSPGLSEAEPVKEEPRSGTAEAAEMMLRNAEAMAAAGDWPDAYAIAGRALRLFLSRTRGDGTEITSEEAAELLSPGDRKNDISGALGRCSTVAFAKSTADPEEFRKIVARIRSTLVSGDAREPEHE
jgi:hypothetical protein